jgi:hypothetical protein
MLETKSIDSRKRIKGVIMGILIGILLSLLLCYIQIAEVYVIKNIGGDDIFAETKNDYLGVIVKLKN